MRLTVYLPSHDLETIKKYAQKLTKVFGGCTVYPNCLGFWENNGVLYEDSITVLEVFIAKDTIIPDLFLEGLRAFCREIKEDLNQISVAYALDNEIYFVE